ncbi:ssDNA-binding protein [Agrobacterium pusense]|uniref:ssDNA-binding protein n=1 Tax=Agrobacterium pusense TaxID=648995 RepID=UPI0038504980
MARSQDARTPLAIASYTKDLFEARERDNGTKGHGCTLLFPKTTDISGLQNLALEAAVDEWGEKAKQWIKDEVIKSPFLDGDGKQAINKKTGERNKGYAGHVFIRCTSGADYKPKVFDKRRNPVLEVDGCPSGSQVYAVVNAYTWENEKNGKGISFGISLVQVVKVAQGEEVLGGGGGPDPDKWLEVIDDEGDAPDSTKGGAGAAGLFS